MPFFSEQSRAFYLTLSRNTTDLLLYIPFWIEVCLKKSDKSLTKSSTILNWNEAKSTQEQQRNVSLRYSLMEVLCF